MSAFNRYKTIIMILMSLSFFACDSNVEYVDEETKIDSQVASKDKLETMYMMQSNAELILADRIISKSTGFVLDLSPEEAGELQIPDELYRKYINKVNELNKQNIN